MSIEKTENFIKKSNLIHNNKFDYSKTQFINSSTKVKIICPIHGEFSQLPPNHFNYDCKKCANKTNSEKYTKYSESFIQKANMVHNKQYDYSKSNYKNSFTPIQIICKEHGSFFASPSNHVDKQSGCPLCSYKNRIKYYSAEYIIEKAQKLHNNEFSYKFKTNLLKRTDKFEIICKKHGSFFQNMNKHLNCKNKCPSCALENLKTSQKEFLLEAFKAHGDLYSYKLTKYEHSHKKIEIECKKHGIFLQTPGKHLTGHGCPNCSTSYGELKVKTYLTNNKIKYIQQKTFPDLKYKIKLRVDFYLPDYNSIIEFNGRQHYEETKFFRDSLETNQIKDLIKKNYCLKNNINFLCIKYNEEVDVILEKFLTNLNLSSTPT